MGSGSGSEPSSRATKVCASLGLILLEVLLIVSIAGLLMLVEAQLGPLPFYQCRTGDNHAEQNSRAADMLSTWGVGRTQVSVGNFLVVFTQRKIDDEVFQWEDASSLAPELSGVMMPSRTVAPTDRDFSSQCVSSAHQPH